MEDFTIQLIGEICWFIPNEKERFPPGHVFRAFAKFTSDFNPSFSVVMNYFPFEQAKNVGYQVRLSFPFAQEFEIQKLASRTEIIILDGYKVLAICRQIQLIDDNKKKMGDPWI